MIEKHYTLPAAADLLSVSGRTLRRWIGDNLIKAVKVNNRWRITESELKRITR